MKLAVIVAGRYTEEYNDYVAKQSKGCERKARGTKGYAMSASCN